jgi:predicted RNA-binding protein (virulence factor B family)
MELHDRSAQDVLADRIVEHLKASGGVSDLTDYSPPRAIYKQFGVSKAKYKKALGRLYKKRLITLEKEKISLI